MNTPQDTSQIYHLFLKLKEQCKKDGIDLEMIEIKGTIFFCPKLPAKELDFTQLI